MFRAIDTDNDGWATGDQVRSVFMQSQLPTSELAQVWQLCEPRAGRLDIRQFALGMWLCNARRHGAPLPAALPRRLAASVAAAGFLFATPRDDDDDDDDDDDEGSSDDDSDGDDDERSFEANVAPTVGLE
jgi:hypothetical protein